MMLHVKLNGRYFNQVIKILLSKQYCVLPNTSAHEILQNNIPGIYFLYKSDQVFINNLLMHKLRLLCTKGHHICKVVWNPYVYETLKQDSYSCSYKMPKGVSCN